MGPLIVDLLSVLLRLSWGWLVLLGPRSVDQRQRGYCAQPRAIEPQVHGPGPLILGPRASDHGPLVLAL